MKKIILALAIFAFVTNAMAQKKISISVNAGIASPSGNLSKTSYDDTKSGFSKTGFHGNVSAVYQISKCFGIGALVGYSQFNHAGSLNLADGYKEDSGTDSTTLYTKGSTGSVSVLVGPAYSIAAGKKLAVHLRVMAGYVHSTLAGFQIFYEDYLDNSLTQNKTSANAFGVQAGAGLSYNVTSKIALFANADYFYSNPKFKISYTNFVVNSGRRLTTYNEKFSGVNATLGIGFTL